MGKIIGIVLGVGLVLGGGYFWSTQARNNNVEQVSAGSQEVVYFYGEECRHCKDVAAFLEENKIAEKVQFEKKEVWHNKVNAAEMGEKANICGLDKRKIGVPFLFAEGKCYISTPEVEGYFKAAAGLPGGEKK